MTNELAMHVSGFLFLFILATGIASRALGYKLDDYDSEARLQQIIGDPRKFQISVGLLLIEHASIIALAIALFVAFGSYSVALGVVWVTFRTGEALVQFRSEIGYWGLLGLARQYADAGDAERKTLIESGRVILYTKNARFTLAMVLFGIGTLAYSILFVLYGVVPSIIGWFGIVVGVLDALGSGIRLAKPDFVVLAYLGGLLTLIFELIIGGWLLVSSPILL
jgi:hypothetical protein